MRKYFFQCPLEKLNYSAALSLIFQIPCCLFPISTRERIREEVEQILVFFQRQEYWEESLLFLFDVLLASLWVLNTWREAGTL